MAKALSAGTQDPLRDLATLASWHKMANVLPVWPLYCRQENECEANINHHSLDTMVIVAAGTLKKIFS
jgi:hypothetical protein